MNPRAPEPSPLLPPLDGILQVDVVLNEAPVESVLLNPRAPVADEPWGSRGR